MLNGLSGILYREFNVYRKKAVKQIMSSSVTPLLYLVAFGWGFSGRGVSASGMPYITFLIPGLIAISSLSQSYSIAQELNITRFYFHIFDEYLVAPINHAEIVLGEALYGMFKGGLSTVIILIFAAIFRVRLSFNPLFILALVLHTFTFATLGISIAMVVRDHGDQATVNNFIITPMLFVCGTFFPIDRFPMPVKYLLHCLPLTYSAKVIRASLTGGVVHPLHLAAMTFFAAVFFCAAMAAVRRVEG